jgi:hypothetical protein
MSFFMFSMPASDLMSSPPVSKHTPLPTSVIFGAAGSPQPMSISRGARGEAWPTAWISGKFCFNRLSPTMTLERGAVPARERLRRVRKLAGPEIVGRRVDEIACERHALGDARELRAVDGLGKLQLGAARLRFAVARELVRSEREGQTREPRVMRRIGEAIGAGRQQPGEAAREEAILLGSVCRLQSEQHARQCAVLARQQQCLPGFGSNVALSAKRRAVAPSCSRTCA